uniref:G-protein coupled receptors family 1 profile domain-containing protein n=1 Tax=Echeneis naucrates TaxID=173247 RepID=A0A665TM82_ECHNA
MENTSNSTLSAPSAPPLPADWVISPNVAYMVAELVIAVLSTFGNLLVCVAVGLNRKLRTVTNYFLVSLAVADILVGTIAIPCAILTDIGLPRHNLYLCLIMLSILLMFTESSILSLLAVAVERYVAIFMPFRYQVLLTSRNAVLVIFATWLLSFVIGLVPLMERQARAAAIMRREVKTVTSLFLVLFLFTVCWIPLHIINCFLLFCPHCPVPLELLFTAIILSHANSAVNPFLYAYTMTTFRDTFKANSSLRLTKQAV